MAPRSDTSDTPTMVTDDLLDFERSSRCGSTRRGVNDDIIQLMTPDNKVVKMKWTILALHSPSLRKLLDDDEDLSVLQITGSQRAWNNIAKLFHEGTTPAPVIPVNEISEAIKVAGDYKMTIVQRMLVTEAVGQVKGNETTVLAILNQVDIVLKPYLQRWLYWEKIIGGGEYRLTVPEGTLWRSIKARHRNEIEASIVALRRKRL